MRMYCSVQKLFLYTSTHPLSVHFTCLNSECSGTQCYLSAPSCCCELQTFYLLQQNRIHCDPTHELEEMIVEPNPLHKKQHRLSRRNVRVTYLTSHLPASAECGVHGALGVD